MKVKPTGVVEHMLIRLLIFISILLSASAVMADDISMVADEWAPYCGKPDSADPGYGVEIAQHIFTAAGHRVLYKIVPWKRAIADTRAGKYNAIIGTYIDEAPDFVFPVEEFGIAKSTFFTKKGDPWQYAGVVSLQGIKIGAISGYSYGKELDALFKQNALQIQYVSGSDPISQNIKKLLAQRFDVVIAEENVFLYKAKQMGLLDRITNAGDPGVSGKLYIAFSPNIPASDEYSEIFSKGIRKLKDSGELDKILRKYGLTYWK